MITQLPEPILNSRFSHYHPLILELHKLTDEPQNDRVNTLLLVLLPLVVSYYSYLPRLPRFDDNFPDQSTRVQIRIRPEARHNAVIIYI